ncbi:hypothetical protein [Pseudomonas sp. NPDC089401]|uniref:hypothetical protein n=1 Tax=Pseudomonas sp. NPDC089401 TaxID=3364462 RepID=UPI0037F425E5
MTSGIENATQEIDELEFNICVWQISGFGEKYAAHRARCIKGAAYSGGLILFIGLAAALYGAAMLIFGPDEIIYPVLAGPTRYQYTQIYAQHIALIGGIMFILGCLLYSRRPMSEVEFLLSKYSLIALGGQNINAVAEIRYLGGDIFDVATD